MRCLEQGWLTDRAQRNVALLLRDAGVVSPGNVNATVRCWRKVLYGIISLPALQALS